MLDYLWAFMLLCGIVYGAFAGNLANITDAVLSSAQEAVTLCITMTGIMAFWMGLMKIAGQAGLITMLTHGISPFLSFLFPHLPREHKAREYIATNFIANFLGLGWACTPAGLKAMEELGKWQKEEKYGTEKAVGSGGCFRAGADTAGNEMCTFLVLNTSSLQLLPINMIAYRATYGSAEPASIVAPALAATCISTVMAVLFCKIACRITEKRRRTCKLQT